MRTKVIEIASRRWIDMEGYAARGRDLPLAIRPQLVPGFTGEFFPEAIRGIGAAPWRHALA